jgi:hypothetical protein
MFATQQLALRRPCIPDADDVFASHVADPEVTHYVNASSDKFNT